MLTGDLVRPRLRKRSGKIKVEGVPPDHPLWLRTAEELIAVFSAQVGKTSADWEIALENYEGERTDYIIIRGLAKVLADAATFETPDTPLLPAEIRRAAFERGPVLQSPDLFYSQTREAVFQGIAAEYNLNARELESALYADYSDAKILREVGQDWTPAGLLERYNLELARGVLYWASQMQIELHDTYKDFWRYMKLFKLMFWAEPLPKGGYQVLLEGPISPFVQATTRYGRQFAAFLPALLLCQRWKMNADIHFERKTYEYRLDDSTPLASHFKRSGEFDSRLEADFAAEFHEKFGDERGGWILQREDEVLLLDDSVMLPDFSLTHKKDGRRALIELMGFWHPAYLRRKVEKVRAAGRRNLILLVYEGVNLSKDALKDVPGEVLYFKNKPVLKDVMAAVERLAE